MKGLVLLLVVTITLISVAGVDASTAPDTSNCTKLTGADVCNRTAVFISVSLDLYCDMSAGPSCFYFEEIADSTTFKDLRTSYIPVLGNDKPPQ